MDARTLLAALHADGVEVAVDGDRLRFRPRDRVTPPQVSALAEHKTEIMRLLTAEADGAGPAPAPVVGVGGSQAPGGQAPNLTITNSVVTVGQQEVQTQGGPLGASPPPEPPVTAGGNSVPDLGPPASLPDLTQDVPHDAGRALLAWGREHHFPLLPLSPGQSIAAGEMRWSAFVSWATHDRLMLALEQTRAASGRRCIILGCWSPCGRGDLVFCRDHRVRADAGLLWAGDAGSQEARDDALAGPGSTQGLKWTQEAPADRTYALRVTVEPEAGVDMVIEPAPNPTNSGISFMALMARLRDRRAQVYVDGDGAAHYVGPVLDDGDPILRALSEHLVLLTEAFTYAPGRRCAVPDCQRLRGPDDTHACTDHLDAVPGGRR